jgi:hypothetical protein
MTATGAEDGAEAQRGEDGEEESWEPVREPEEINAVSIPWRAGGVEIAERQKGDLPGARI